MGGKLYPFKLIRAGSLYSPKPQGAVEVLVCFERIVSFGSDYVPPDVEVYDFSDCTVIPGLIDQHVHFAGGGGEGGFQNRTPEASLSALTRAGITTAVGLLGTDATTRSVQGLLAKARGLFREGLTTYIYTGAYEVPTRTITGSVRTDIVLINEVLGAGEIAIADHRSAHPSDQELARIASEVRVGGLLSGKAGILHLHVGDGDRGLESLFVLADNTDLPLRMFVPTHVNRNPDLLADAARFAEFGGTVDITSSICPDGPKSPAIKPSRAVMHLLERGIPQARITMSSDGYGSSPIFSEGELVEMDIGHPETLFAETRELVLNFGVPLEEALRLVTENPAKTLGIYPEKGYLAPGSDADLVALDQDLRIRHVVARGRLMVKDYEPVVLGTFEGK